MIFAKLFTSGAYQIIVKKGFDNESGKDCVIDQIFREGDEEVTITIGYKNRKDRDAKFAAYDQECADNLVETIKAFLDA